MFTTARRISLVIGVLGYSSLSAMAQAPSSTTVQRPAVDSLRPVPKHRSRIATRRDTPADPQHDGWNLKWRKSSQMASRSSAAAARRSGSQNSHSRSQPASLRELLSRNRPTGGAPQPARRDHSAGTVSQATWLADPQQSGTFALPNDLHSAAADAGGAENNFFNDPFGDAAPADPESTPRSNAPATGPVEEPVPAPTPSQPLEVLDLPAPEPAGPAAQDSLQQRQQPAKLAAPQDSVQTLPAPAPEDAADQEQEQEQEHQQEQEQEQDVSAQRGTSSLGRMLRQNRPDEPDEALARPANSRPIDSPSAPAQPVASPGQSTPSQSAPSQSIPGQSVPSQFAPAEPSSPQSPPPATESRPESPSDLQPLGPNPFDRVRDGDEQPERRQAAPRGEDGAGIYQDRDEPVRGETGISCEEFRDRIAAQTIRQVSLDISPPFRPDVIEQAQYDELKAEFDEAQQVRQWRTIEGRLLGEGRLRDLAYEKVVIETEQGTLQRLPLEELSEGDLAYISNNWGLPTECRIAQVDRQPRRWAPTTMTWAASNLCHHPLYFEQVNLERYGHTAGPVLQPVISSAHFFANIAVLPYKTGVHSPHECQYALGYYRPGNCAPWIIPPVPLSLEGTLRQAASMTGSYLLVP